MKKQGKGEEPETRRTITLYIRKDHYKLLERISEKTGIPVSQLIELGLERFLTKLEELQMLINFLSSCK